jgi:dipeptidyl aminopeptidase/acylaminoacyl peptidase
VKPKPTSGRRLLYALGGVLGLLFLLFVASLVWGSIPDQVQQWIVRTEVRPVITAIQIARQPQLTETAVSGATISVTLAASAAPPSSTPEPPGTSTSTSLPTKTSTPTPLPTKTFTPTPESTWRQGKLVFPVREKDVNALYQWDLETQNEMQKIFMPPSGFFLVSPMWSQDGQTIAFNYYSKGMYTIEARADSRPVKRYDCDTPSWSPDGSQILCKSVGEASFVIVNIASNSLANRYPQHSNARLPIWSPVGDEYAYTLLKDGITGVWRVGLAQGSSPVLLAGTASENYAPSWSPDGQWLAFQSNRDSDLSEIWIIHRSEEDLRRITYSPAGTWSRAPSWSPDGQWLAYVSNQAGGIGSDYGEIFVVSIQTGETEQITQTGGVIYNWRINWSK